MPDDMSFRTPDMSVRPKTSGFVSDFEWGLERFLDEGKLLAKFDHPNIVRVLRFFKAHGTAYIVMEYLDGPVLSYWLTETQVTSERLQPILKGLLSGLKLVHKHDYLHLGIKPSNIIMRQNNVPVLLERRLLTLQDTETLPSFDPTIFPGYTPIEKYSLNGNHGPWTDIYALGAVIYKAITGDRPIDAPERVLRDPHKFLSGQKAAASRGFSEAFTKAVDWAMAFDGQERPQTIEAWEKALFKVYLRPSLHPDPSPTKPYENPQISDQTGDVFHIAALPSGTTISDIQFRHVRAKGSFGFTYFGWDHTFNCTVAIKEYIPEDMSFRAPDMSVRPRASGFVSDFEWGLERFLEEAKFLIKADHPNIVKVLRAIRANGTAYIVMEYLVGPVLSDWLMETQVTSDLLAPILSGLLKGLKHLHEYDYFHREIIPENIILLSNNVPVFIDFGVLKFSAITDPEKPLPESFTQGYLPIEHYSSNGNHGPWTDIYALGALIYKAITGDRPVEASERVLRDPHKFLSGQKVAASRGFSEAFTKAVDWAMAFDGRERPQTIEVWEKALFKVDDLRPSFHPNPSPTKPYENPISDQNGDVFHVAALPSGTIISDIEFKHVLKPGGFGITYYGWEHGLDRPVAIKEYMPNDMSFRTPDMSVRPKTSGFVDDFEWGLERFLDEGKLLAKFNHPNIVRVLRFFKAHGTAYIVMEYVDGPDLSDWLTKTAITPECWRPILKGLIDALRLVHKHDYLHRDIKPGNIMMRDNNVPVLIDFGSARQAIGAKTQPITALVSEGYAPIEQYTSTGEQGPWTDIYALGAVIYKAVTGDRPNEATARALRDTHKFLCGHKNALPKGFSDTFLKAVDWAMAFDGEERPQTLDTWERALLGSETS